MAQYIDKAAVVAEIEKRLSLLEGGTGHPEVVKRVEGVIKGYKSILSFLDTVETKDLNLEKEIQDHTKECLDIKFPTTDIELIKKDVAYTARKFFELGLKASDTELENLLWTLPERIADERSHQVYLMSLYRFDGQCVVDYVGELEGDSLVSFVGETFMEAATKMREWMRMRKEPKAG